MELPITLEGQLADALPESIRVRAYHISTPATPSTAIFSAPPGQTDEPTSCESHFLGLSSPEEGNEGDRDIFVFAIEVLIFSTPSLTTVFVSKADSSGFISRLHLPPASPSIPQTVSRVFLNYLLKPRLSGKKLILSLFARSQHSYLFPGSAENAEKHVLDDRQLIKWWCKVLDAVWRPYHQIALGSRNLSYAITAHVVVPGSDNIATRGYFPASHTTDPEHAPRWLARYPIEHMAAADQNLPLRCVIPRLPDDPKSRFLQDLDDDYVSSQGDWRSVKKLDDFWEMMSYRQECAAGRLVGFIWIIFSPREMLQAEPEDNVTLSFTSDASDHQLLPTPESSQHLTRDQRQTAGTEKYLRPVPLSSSPPSSPVSQDAQNNTIQQIRLNEKAITSKPSEEREDAANAGDLKTETKVLGPSITPGHVSISAVDYELLIEELLHKDFAGQGSATESTQKWLQEVASKAVVSKFGTDIVGKRPLVAAEGQKQDAQAQINVLTGIRKKRKAEDHNTSNGTKPDTSTPQLLSANLIRKKPKSNEVV